MNKTPTQLELQLATKIAWRVGSRWSHVEPEDLASHLTLWLFQNQNHLERWRENDVGKGRLYVSLKREAAKYCAKETAAKVGQPTDAGRFYSVERIRQILPFIFEQPFLDAMPVNPHTGQAIGQIPSGQVAVMLMDVRSAFYDLPIKTRELIALRFRDGLAHEEIAELRGLTIEATKTAIHRALKKISDTLGE